MWNVDEHSDYLELDECARRMGLSRDQVLDMVSRRVLRAVDLGGWIIVEPAIVSGAV